MIAYCGMSVCMSVTLVHPDKVTGRNMMPFGRDTRVVPSNTVLERGKGDLWDRIVDSNPHAKFALQIAAKPLQIAELLLQTASRNSATPYPTVPSRRRPYTTGRLKTRDWKTRDQICRGGKRRTGKHGNIICMSSKT